MKGKVEDVELPEKADILISEPMGKLHCWKTNIRGQLFPFTADFKYV